MLTTTSYRDVKVIDIAREAGTSPATFYQYFADVEAAILVLAEEMAQQGAAPHRRSSPTGRGTGRRRVRHALALVDAFLAFWDDHRPVLRVMDLATDEGDGRFQKIRVRLLNDITKRAGRRHPRRRSAAVGCPQALDPMAVGRHRSSSMLAHTAAHQYGFEFWGIRTAKLRDVDGPPGVLGRHRHQPARLMATTTAADGVEIAYDVTGDGPVLVLVHGITESRRAWDPLVADLASDHTVVAVDVRGHGESALADTYDSQAMAGDVAAVLDGRRPRRPAPGRALDGRHRRHRLRGRAPLPRGGQRRPVDRARRLPGPGARGGADAAQRRLRRA